MMELQTGLKHGFLFKALPAWLEPTIAWGKQRYEEVGAKQ